jgi:hypothetical protein
VTDSPKRLSPPRALAPPSPRQPSQRGKRLEINSGLGHRYLSALYWSLTTLMKSSWCPPGTTGEKVYASLCVFVGGILFAFILASVASAVNAFDEANSKRRAKIATMRRFSVTRKLRPVTHSHLLNYVDAEWQMTDGIDDINFLRTSCELPVPLRNELLEAMHGSFLHQAPLFRNVSRACVMKLLIEMAPQACTAKSVLLQSNDICMEVFLLHKGSLRVEVDPSAYTVPPELQADSGEGGRSKITRGSETDRAKQEAQFRISRTTRGSVLAGEGGFGGGTKKKVGQQFRVVERSGQAVGMWSPYHTPWRSPFTVSAIKLTHLYVIQGDVMASVLAQFKQTDEPIIVSNLESEFAQVAGKQVLTVQKEIRTLISERRQQKSLAGRRTSEAALNLGEAALTAEIRGKATDADITTSRLLDKINESHDLLAKLPTIAKAVQFMMKPEAAGAAKPTLKELEEYTAAASANRDARLQAIVDQTKAAAEKAAAAAEQAANSPRQKAGDMSQRGDSHRNMGDNLTKKLALAHQTQEGTGDDVADRERKNVSMAGVLSM